MGGRGKMNKTKGSQHMYKGDYHLAVREADVFYDAACMCETKHLMSDGTSGHLYAFVVNLSFACEVYMKAIMIYSSEKNEFSGGHELNKLFEMLPQTVKDVVKAEFEQVPRVVKKGEIRNLDTFLKTHKKAFETFRYAFQEREKGKNLVVYSTDLGTFANSLKKYCENNLKEKKRDEQA